MSDRTVVVPAPYPLSWPPTKPRTPAHQREKGHYSLRTMTQAMGTVEVEVQRWQKRDRPERIIDWEITTNHVGRSRDPEDPGAALWFTLGGKAITGPASLMVLACDRFQELPQNVRALSLTMERLRLVADVGAYSLVAAVEGARALPPPERPVDWRAVLGLGPGANVEIANAVYRTLVKGADEARLRELNAAIEVARKELGRDH